VELPLKMLFAYPTISSLTQYIESNRQLQQQVVKQVNEIFEKTYKEYVDSRKNSAVDNTPAVSDSALYVNAWFPDYNEGSWLTVGETSHLLVNLGPKITPSSLSISDHLTRDDESLVNAAEYIDIMVLCANADVAPLRARLPMPPKPECPAKFDVTPRIEGDLELTVVLMICNEPLHYTTFCCEARISEPKPSIGEHKEMPEEI